MLSDDVMTRITTNLSDNPGRSTHEAVEVVAQSQPSIQSMSMLEDGVRGAHV